MRFSSLIAGALAAASTALASPLGVSTTGSGEVAGSVVTNNSVTYYMDKLYDIKAFANKDANGMYPRPMTYEVKAGFTCIFYLEATRGVGPPIGSFAGPTTGVFKDWVTTYKCTPGTNSASEGIVTVRNDAEDEAFKTCGWAYIPGYDNGDLECGKETDNPQEFVKSGYQYEADSYGVSAGATCKFFVKKGSPVQVKGPATGTFQGRVATHYLCWPSTTTPSISPNTMTARSEADFEERCAEANVPDYGKIWLLCNQEANKPDLFPKKGANKYRVLSGATCRFAVGNGVLPEIKGPANGELNEWATDFKCWEN